jgi:hypothetical protein
LYPPNFCPSTERGSGVIAYHPAAERFGRLFILESVVRFFSNASDEPQDEQQHNRANRGTGDDANNAETKMNSQSRQQPTADKGADYANDNVAEKTKPAAFDDKTSEHPGDRADHEPNE